MFTSQNLSSADLLFRFGDDALPGTGWTRPAISYAQFLGTIPVLPFKLGSNSPRSRVYTAGHYPYDQVAPLHSKGNKLSKRSLLLQGAATTGLIFFLP